MDRRLNSIVSALNSNQHLKEVLLKAGNNLWLRLIGNLLSYLLVYMLLKLFGPSHYGQWSHAVTLLLVFRLLFNLGLKPAIVRAFSDFHEVEDKKHYKTYYIKALIITVTSGLLGVLIVFFCSSLFADLYQKIYLNRLLKILAFAILPASIIDVHSGMFKGVRSILRHTFYENISNPLFSLLLISITYLLIPDFEYAIIAFVIGLYIVCILSFISVYKEFPSFSEKIGKSELRIKSVLSVSFIMLTNSSLELIMRWADVLLIGFFCTEIEIGAYYLVSRLATAISIPLQAVNSILTSKFRQLFQLRKMKDLAKVAQNTANVSFLLAFVPSLVLFILGRFIIGVFDSTYIFAYSSLVVLVISQISISAFGSVLHFLNMANKHSQLMRIQLSTTALNVLLNLVLIPFVGLLGAAASTAFTTVLTYFVAYRLIVKYYDFSPAFNLISKLGSFLPKQK